MSGKTTRGGKREGAGRKAKAPREVLYVRVAEGTVAKLREIAKQRGCAVSDVIEIFINKKRINMKDVLHDLADS